MAGFAPAQAGQTVLYSFKASGKDAAEPVAGLITDTQGALYGTTENGGASGQGTVFKLTPPASGTGPWTESILYSFTGAADGAYPEAELTFDTQGALYGTASSGGGSTNAGTVFKLTPPASGQTQWTFKVLYAFKGGADGGKPNGGVIFDTQGALYSTAAAAGGSANAGAVFKLTPPASSTGAWTETVLYSFKGGTDGAEPRASLIFDTQGALYGTTTHGGSANAGAVFKLAPPASATGAWTETLPYSFKGGGEGFGQGKLIFDAYGALYGITQDGQKNPSRVGQGVVFKLTQPASGAGAWTETALYNLKNSGALLEEGLVFDTQGSLYGVTWDGGSANKGAVFKLTPPATSMGAWTQSILYSFTGGSDGFEPHGGVIFGRGGALFGTAKWGGASGLGTVFQITRPGCSN